MANVMLVQPWNYHDEHVADQDLGKQWRNGPYALLLLATQLKRHGHNVQVVDLIRDLIVHQGNLDATLDHFAKQIVAFKPDILGVGFFSIHYFEVQKLVRHARATCEQHGLKPVFIGGGIHASTEPADTIANLGFDYAFKGEADLGLVALANGSRPDEVQGIITLDTTAPKPGEEIKPLDALPFPDWTLCDHAFYSTPTTGRIKFRKTSSLDLIMGRGCSYKCAFCAYNALSAVRFYSPEYLVEQMHEMHAVTGTTGFYFTDSTIGNNRRVLEGTCEEILRRGLQHKVEWYANIRPNQVSEKLLRLMWDAGCRYLFYGFESNSQRVLDLMAKQCRTEANLRAAELHNKLGFPYHASMLLGYPGEREEDIAESMAFLRKVKPPSIGINWYVPLPGSPDYDKLRATGVINTDDPEEWRRIGEVNKCRVYADVPDQKFRELFKQAERLAYVELAKETDRDWQHRAAWGCLAPASSELPEETQEELKNTLKLVVLPQEPKHASACGTGCATDSTSNDDTLDAARARATYGKVSARKSA